MTSSAAGQMRSRTAGARPVTAAQPQAAGQAPGARRAPALSGLPHGSAGEPASRRDAGPRAGRASVAALRRQHAGAVTLRRVKILGPSGPLHINDYHFIDRLTLGNAPRSGEHDVIVTEFTDFDGLAVEANQHPGEEFDFGDVRWGWKGTDEIFPIVNGKTCIRLSTAQIEELITTAKDGGDAKKATFAGLSTKVTTENKAIEGFRSVRQQRSVPVRVDLPITTTANKLRSLGRVRFAPGSYWTDALEKGTGNAEAFLMGPNGSKEEGPHLHLFLTCKAKKADVHEYDHPFVITGYVMTTSHKKHLVLDPDGVAVDKKTQRKPALEKTEPAQVEEMTLLCGLLHRAGTEQVATTSSATGEKKAEKKVEKHWQAKEAAVKDKDVHVGRLATMMDVRVPVLQYFLTTIAALEADDIEGLAMGRSRLREAGFGPEESLLPALDQLAKKLGKSEDDVIALLDPAAYPSIPEEVVLFYKNAMSGLQT